MTKMFYATRRMLFGLAVGSLWSTSVKSHEGHSHDDDELCGTEVPPLEEELINQIRLDTFHKRRRERGLQLESCHDLCDQCIEIETYLHIFRTD